MNKDNKTIGLMRRLEAISPHPSLDSVLMGISYMINVTMNYFSRN